MKKYNKLFIAAAVFASIFFAGCSDSVFYHIEHDVISESATVVVPVRSIARYTTPNQDEYIVCAGSEGFQYKRVYDAANSDWTTATQSHGKWTVVDASQLPFKPHFYDYTEALHHGQQIIKVTADSDTIYLATVEYSVDYDEGISYPSKIFVWAVKPVDSDNDGIWDTLKAEDYTEVIEANGVDLSSCIYFSSDYYYTNFNIFSTNAPQKANRKVYLRAGDKNRASDLKNKYYELSGTSVSEILIPSVADSTSVASAVDINGAAYFNGTVNFFTTSSVTTNETLTTDASVIYWANKSKLCYAQDSLENANKDYVDAKHTVTSLAFCSDALLIGRGSISASQTSATGGIQKVQITDGIPAAELGTFTTNAQTQILTSYIVSVVFNTNPADAELDSSLYASIYFIGSNSSGSVSFNNEGLWSYYPSRGNWNRE